MGTEPPRPHGDTPLNLPAAWVRNRPQPRARLGPRKTQRHASLTWKRRGLHRTETLGPHRPDPQGGVAQGLPAAEQGLGAACPSSLQPGAERPSPSGFQGDGDPGEGSRPGQAGGHETTEGSTELPETLREEEETPATQPLGKQTQDYRSGGTRERRSGGGKSGLLQTSRPLSSWGSVSAIPKTGGWTRLWDRGCPQPLAQQ